MTPGTRAAIVLRYLDRTGPTSPEVLCDLLTTERALPGELDPSRVRSSLYRLCRAGRAERRGDGLYAPRRLR